MTTTPDGQTAASHGPRPADPAGFRARPAAAPGDPLATAPAGSGARLAGTAIGGVATRGTAISGVGVDAVDIARFRQLLARRPKTIDRLFTSAELDRAGRRVDPVPTLAARFAAKEATMKALGVGVGGIRWHDVEVGAADSGAPVLVVRGRASTRAEAAGVGRWHVSLTHTDAVAVATVVAETVSPPGAEAVAPAGAEAVAPAGAEATPPGTLRAATGSHPAPGHRGASDDRAARRSGDVGDDQTAGEGGAPCCLW